jgi:hypothetical protein
MKPGAEPKGTAVYDEDKEKWVFSDEEPSSSEEVDEEVLEEIRKLVLKDLLQDDKKTVNRALKALIEACSVENEHHHAICSFVQQLSGQVTLVAAMEKFSKETTVLIQCCEILRRVGFEAGGFSQAASSAGALESVLSAMTQFPLNKGIQTEGMGALLALSHNEELLRLAADVTEGDGLHVILQAMKAFPTVKPLTRWACMLLQHMATLGDLKKTIVENGGLIALATAVSDYRDEEDSDVREIQHYGRSAMRMLIAEPEREEADKKTGEKESTELSDFFRTVTAMIGQMGVQETQNTKDIATIRKILVFHKERIEENEETEKERHDLIQHQIKHLALAIQNLKGGKPHKHRHHHEHPEQPKKMHVEEENAEPTEISHTKIVDETDTSWTGVLEFPEPAAVKEYKVKPAAKEYKQKPPKKAHGKATRDTTLKAREPGKKPQIRKPKPHLKRRVTVKEPPRRPTVPLNVKDEHEKRELEHFFFGISPSSGIDPTLLQK